MWIQICEILNITLVAYPLQSWHKCMTGWFWRDSEGGKRDIDKAIELDPRIENNTAKDKSDNKVTASLRSRAISSTMTSNTGRGLDR